MAGNNAVDWKAGSLDLPFGCPFNITRMLIVPVIGELGERVTQPAQIATLFHHPRIFQELGVRLVLLRFVIPELDDRQILRGMQMDREPFVCRHAMDEIEKYADRAIRRDFVFRFQQIALCGEAGVFLEFAKLPLEFQIVFVNTVGMKDLPCDMPARDGETVFIYKKQCGSTRNNVAPCVITDDKVNRTGKLIYFFNSINKHKKLAEAVSN